MSHLPAESTPLIEEGLSGNKREDNTTNFATIIVKHLPSELSDAEARRLFEHYGALDMRRFHDGKMV
jgi:hypothetical protein